MPEPDQEFAQVSTPDLNYQPGPEPDYSPVPAHEPGPGTSGRSDPIADTPSPRAQLPARAATRLHPRPRLPARSVRPLRGHRPGSLRTRAQLPRLRARSIRPLCGGWARRSRTARAQLPARAATRLHPRPRLPARSVRPLRGHRPGSLRTRAQLPARAAARPHARPHLRTPPIGPLSRWPRVIRVLFPSLPPPWAH